MPGPSREPEIAHPRSCHCFFLALFLLSCGSEGPGVQAPPCVEVTWNLTSGLPPPGFELGEPEALEELRDRISGLPEAPPRAEPPFGSFYLAADEARCDLPARIAVFEGVIMVTPERGPTRFFQDTKGLAEYLAGKAAASGALDRFMERQVPGPRGGRPH